MLFLASAVPTGIEAATLYLLPLLPLLWLGNSILAVRLTFRRRLGPSALAHVAVPMLVAASLFGLDSGLAISLAMVALLGLQLLQLVYLLRRGAKRKQSSGRSRS